MTPITHTNFNTNAVESTGSIYNGYKSSSAAQNDSISFDVVLAAGTWTIELMHISFTNRGIYTVALDGVSAGTIDGYSASMVFNVKSTVTGIAVAAAGKQRLSLTMATKNGSSSNYIGIIQHLQLRRTA